MAWAATGGAALVAVEAAGCSSRRRTAALPVVGKTLYSVVDYGAVGDGHTNDTAAVQAAVNAAGATGGGTIFWPPGCLTNIQSAITLPAKGNYEFVSAGESASIYAVNDGYPPGQRTNGVLITGDIGGQPATIGHSDLYRFIFDCSAAAGSGQGEFTVAWRHMMVFDRSGNTDAVAFLTGQCYAVDFEACLFQGISLAYLVGNGGGQMYRMTVRGCLGVGPMFWADGTAPFIGEVCGNEWYGTGETGNPMPHGHIIEQNTYWTWFVHDNVFQSGASIANPRADIYIGGIDQTCLGAIHDNSFYGSPGGCIYWQDHYSWDIANETGGLMIHDNEYTDWNKSNRGGFAAAAVYIDHSTAGSVDQIITIGKNNWIGGSHSTYGLVIVDDPDTAAVVFDREQNMRGIQRAPYRIGGVNYGAAGASHRFQANVAAPAVPASNSPLTNPFGFDATVYLARGTVTAVAINGTATGLTSGMFRVPRDATIRLTYEAAPSWTWFAD